MIDQGVTESPKSIPLEIPRQDKPSEGETSMKEQVDLPQSNHSSQLWKKPKLKQYWHDGVLYRSRSSNNVDISVLFVDLLYVGIIAINADNAIEDSTPSPLLHFATTFLPTWKVWSDIAILVSQFEADSLTQRSIILFILACLVGFTTNISSAWDTTYGQLIAFYIAARITVAIVTLVLAFFIPRIRPIMLFNLLSILIPLAFWIRSCFSEKKARETFIWLAICWDMWGSFLTVYIIRDVPKISKALGDKIARVFQYFPAVEVEHRSERIGAFVSLVFGYSVVGILYQNQSKFGINAFYGKAVLGLIQAFCFNWMYFDVDERYQTEPAHLPKKHTISAALWFNAHLPLIMGFTLSSAALSKLVVAHDCPNADPERLMPTFAERSEAELPRNLRWFYCAGLGIAFFSMGVISVVRGEPLRQNERIPHIYRLAFRAAVAVMWICLPLADSLNSLELIGITTSTTVLTLIIDVYGIGSYEGFSRENTREYETKPVHRNDTLMGF
ncbi:hypothetical protein FRC04_004644 [Tulasnella sp. 424]|nr:hypothetical protein FRC04_004644 [Tulasnella sp. 424]